MSDDESLFARVARQSRISAPPMFCAAADWSAHCHKVWACFPAWGHDPAWVTEIARPFLPRILAQMGFVEAIGRVTADRARAWAAGIPRCPDPRAWSWRWVVQQAGGRTVPLRGRGPEATGLALRAVEGEILYIDEVALDWMCPGLACVGQDLVELGEWRWQVGPSKAAFRIAKLCGHRRPVPPPPLL